MTKHEHSDERVEALLDEALPALEPSSGFADKVINANRAPARREGRGRWSLVVAVAAGFLLATTVQQLPALPGSGDVSTNELVELSVGPNGRAVAKPGAELTWSTAFGGATQVEQTVGSVFYDVEPGSEFAVDTPAGTVSVTGTSFSVAIHDAVSVRVHAGRVSLQNTSGRLELVAGEIGLLAAGVAPQKIGPVAAGEQPRVVRRVASGPGPASGTRVDALEQENRVLRAELERLGADIADERLVPVAEREEGVPFPPDLPDAYREPALLTAFRDAIDASGTDVELAAIDCIEYPCIVYTELTPKADVPPSSTAIRDIVKKLEEQISERYPESDNRIEVLVGLRHDDQGTKSTIGFVLTPAEGGSDEMVQERTRHRVNQYFEATLED